jgi:RNA polymerase sigma-70 factor (ECF subfamily)
MQQEEFMKLYEPIHEQLARYCRAISKIKEDAEDLMNETIMIAFQNFEKLKDSSAFKYYCFKIASNLAKHSARRNKVQYQPEELWPEVAGSFTSPEMLIDYAIVYREIMRMPEKVREAIILYYISDQTYEDIQKIQGGSLS